MTIPTFDPSPAPSPGTQVTYEIKTKLAAFGDGYTQETRDGVNHMRRVAVLKWDTLNATMAATLDAFFVAQGGDLPFLYTLSGDTQRQWTCKVFSRTRGAPDQYTATLREDFNRT